MITWPDLVIGGIALLFALKGWKRGFVSEIGGFIALAAAVWAAFNYPGSLDASAKQLLHLGDGSAHVVGMIAFAALVYIALLAISMLLSKVAKLPLIGIGNGIGGAAVGVAKALVGAWIVLYAVLFFPLPRDLHDDLHRSSLVGIVTAPNAKVDPIVQATMPWFVRPFVAPLFQRHHV